VNWIVSYPLALMVIDARPAGMFPMVYVPSELLSRGVAPVTWTSAPEIGKGSSAALIVLVSVAEAWTRAKS
jgi:hypothetical protein